MIEILILVIERAILWSFFFFFFFFSGLTNSVVYLIGQLLFIFSDYPVSMIRSWNLEKKLNFGLDLCWVPGSLQHFIISLLWCVSK